MISTTSSDRRYWQYLDEWHVRLIHTSDSGTITPHRLFDFTATVRHTNTQTQQLRVTLFYKKNWSWTIRY